MEEKIKQTLKTLKEKLKMFGTKEDTQKTEHKPNSKENVNKRQNVNLESKSELRQMKEKPEETIKKEKNEKQKTPSISESPYKKMKLYIPGIDELFTEGVPEGSSIIIEGGPGSGKTAFCLNLLHEQCIRGRKVLYMSFEEPEDRLKQHMRDFGWNPDALEKKGLLLIKRFQALDISRSVEALLSEAKRELLIDIQPVLIPTDFEPELICVDSLSAIASAFSGEESRFRIYMEQLFRYLEKHKITSFLI